MKENNKPSLKSISKERKEAHKQHVADKISEIQSDGIERETDYLSSKKLRWYDYIIIIAVCAILIGVSFIISIFTLNDLIKTEYFTSMFGIIALVIWLIMGFIRNNNTAKFYNDSRRRYQSTFTVEEGRNRRISKIILFIGLVLLVTTTILLLIFLL